MPESAVLEKARRAGELLLRHHIMIVTAESCTGGLVATALTSVAGSSAWFERGFITYSNAAKLEQLDVPVEVLHEHGAVSEQVVLAMARGAIEHSQAHVSVSVSGVAGPDGGTADKPVGTVWIGWGQKLGYAEARCFHFSGDREAVRQAAAEAALDGVIARLS